MSKYRKKLIVIEAVQWTGDNLVEIETFTGTIKYPIEGDALLMDTLEGIMRVNIGDWIIKGVNGEFYPCTPDIFEKTYELV